MILKIILIKKSLNYLINKLVVNGSLYNISKAVYCHPAYILYAKYIMRNAGLEEAQAGIKIAGEISITSDMQMTPPLWQKVKRNSKVS